MRIHVQNRARGFSLVELLLTLVLVLSLAAAAVFSFTAIYRSANLDEGLSRMESLIRFAQAEAATTGRKVRLEFEPVAAPDVSGTNELRRVHVTWEPDFLTAPGVFQTFTNKSWSEDMVNELVGVESVNPVKTEVETTLATLPTADSLEVAADEFLLDPFPAITFYPDGSCDSAEIILASLNNDDQRRLALRISGILGSVSSHAVSADDEGSTVDEMMSNESAAQEFNDVFETAAPADPFAP